MTSSQRPISAGDLFYWPDSEEPEFGVVTAVEADGGRTYARTFWALTGDFSEESVRGAMPHEVWGSVRRVG